MSDFDENLRMIKKHLKWAENVSDEYHVDSINNQYVREVDFLLNYVDLLERKLELAIKQRDMFILEKTWPTSTMTGVRNQLNKELQELK